MPICRLHLQHACTRVYQGILVTAADIEALTAKAGSPRRYEAFVAMLLAALRRTSTSVSLDILSSSDLAPMTSDAGHSGVKSFAARSSAGNSKRYVILSYLSEFERVHYPLPLALQDWDGHVSKQRTTPAASTAGPAISDLLAEISRLRKECSALRGSRHEYQHANGLDLRAAVQKVGQAGNWACPLQWHNFGQSVTAEHQARQLTTCSVSSIMCAALATGE